MRCRGGIPALTRAPAGPFRTTRSAAPAAEAIAPEPPLGDDGTLRSHGDGCARDLPLGLHARDLRTQAGPSEIQRNIIAGLALA